jgi:hypothetical protein
MKAVGPCCTWEDFWFSFVRNFLRGVKHATRETQVPDFVEKRARHYWRVYGMTGYEAAVTCHQALADGKL